MKKWTSLLLALAMTLSLAACGDSGTQENTSEPPASVSGSTGEETPAPTGTETPAEEPTEAPAEETAESETSTTGDSSSVLIAYFSWSGNTEQVAQIIQQETGGDLFEIAPATPYTNDYNELLDIAQQEQSDNARPELAGQVENWEQYDTIFVGYPNWWSDAPMAVYTFLESYDWDGKTLVPFNTSASGGFGRSLSGLEESASGAAILEGRAPLGLRSWRVSPLPSVPLEMHRAKWRPGWMSWDCNKNGKEAANMPHVAITMIPGRDEETKLALAKKTQEFLVGELGIDPKFVSVSIQDIPMEDWQKSMEQFPDEIMYVKPGV